MLKKGTIFSNLYELILPQAETIKVTDLRMVMQASRSKIVTRGLPQFYLISCRMVVRLCLPRAILPVHLRRTRCNILSPEKILSKLP
jgi:hypothetical protein